MEQRLLLLIVFLTYSPVWAQFRYTPERPKIDGIVSFTYTPTGPLTQETAIQAVALRYGSPEQMRLSQPETFTAAKVGDVFVGTIKIPFKEVAGMLVAFQPKTTGRAAVNPAMIDHNNTHFYPILLYDRAGKNRLPHAIGGQASVLMRTSFPYLMKLKPDWAWAIEQYERELREYPTLRPLYWADIVRAKIKEAKPDYRPTCLAEIKTYLDSRGANLTPADLTAAGQLYDQLKEFKLAQDARNRIRSVDPTTPAVQKARAEAIQAMPDLAEKLAGFKALITATPRSTYRAMAVSSIAEAYFKDDKLRELVNFIGAEALGETDPAQLLKFAQTLASEGRGWAQAEWLANRAVWAFNKKTVVDRTANVRAAQTVLAQAADQQGNALTALNAYRDVLAGTPANQTDPRLNERIWLCARKAAKADSVLPFIQNALRAGRSTPTLRANLREWQTSRLGGVQELATYVSNLELIDEADRRAAVTDRLISEPASAFTLQTLDGRQVSLASYANKVVVLNFWATWSDACLAALPAIQQVRDQFRNDPTVQFLFINSQEVEPVRKVRRFIAKRPGFGLVPLDSDQKVASAYRVKLVPGTLVIDRAGQVRYRVIGYSGNPATTASELKEVIEAVR